jgi:hypothetical protein
MILALIIIATCLGLMGLVIFLYTRVGAHCRSQADSTLPSLLEAGATLSSLRLAERIFSQVDLEFILREPPSIQQELLRERRDIALFWIRQSRNAARAIMRFHRLISRTQAALRPELEFRLAANYVALLAACLLAELSVRLWGPSVSRKIIPRLLATGDRMRLVSEALLGNFDPGFLEEVPNSQSGQFHAK